MKIPLTARLVGCFALLLSATLGSAQTPASIAGDGLYFEMETNGSYQGQYLFLPANSPASRSCQIINIDSWKSVNTTYTYDPLASTLSYTDPVNGPTQYGLDFGSGNVTMNSPAGLGGTGYFGCATNNAPGSIANSTFDGTYADGSSFIVAFSVGSQAIVTDDEGTYAGTYAYSLANRDVGLLQLTIQGETAHEYLGFASSVAGAFESTPMADGSELQGGSFQMEETNLPNLQITSPKNGQVLGSTQPFVTGTATENWGIEAVYCEVQGDYDWTAADSTNGFTNWFANLTFSMPGTNIIFAYAVDEDGNVSVTNEVTVVYSVPAPVFRSPTNAQQFLGSSCPLNWVITNGPVAGVYYQMQGDDSWLTATTTDGVINWNGDVTLTAPGNNVIQAYSVDVYGNASQTNAVDIDYVVSAPLTVQVNPAGWGSFAPANENGKLLPLGGLNTVTAKAATGFAFLNWSGNLGALANGNSAALTFTMASNLVLTASFVDITKPTVAITAPAASDQVSTGWVTVAGTAWDNVAVENIACFVNGLPVNTAPSNSSWTNWTAQASLTPGTNIIVAQAVGTGGLFSGLVTNKVIYTEKGLLLVQISPSAGGSVTPNLNNTNLALNMNFSMTAKAAAGFAFSHWVGNLGPLANSNSAALTFMMRSNLILTASFMDITKPILTITAPTLNQRVSSAQFTVAGAASDNAAVSNVVCLLNGAPVSTVLGATNWSAAVTLSAGTNAVQAYAVDTSGNYSTTNHVVFDFVVTNQLSVRMSGLGTLAPNDSNTWLEVGRTYSVTATPATGFVFSNWTSGIQILTNKSTLTFTMAPGTSLAANFLDIQKPTESITSPAANITTGSNSFLVAGKAADNLAVSKVFCRTTNTLWQTANSTNGWATWTASISLQPGANVVQSYAVDTTGNVSATNTVIINHPCAVLTVLTNGAGTLSPNYNGNVLAESNSYSMTATAAFGYTFTNWTSGAKTLTNGPTLTFTMASNLVLTANFARAPRPTILLTGPLTNSVNYSTVAVEGNASGALSISSVSYQVNNTAWQAAQTDSTGTNWAAVVELNPGTNILSLVAVDISGTSSATNQVTLIYNSGPAGTWQITELGAPSAITLLNETAVIGGTNFTSGTGEFTITTSNTVSGYLGAMPLTGSIQIETNGLAVLTLNNTTSVLSINAVQDTMVLVASELAGVGTNYQEMLICQKVPASGSIAFMQGPWQASTFVEPYALLVTTGLEDNVFMLDTNSLLVGANGGCSGSIAGTAIRGTLSPITNGVTTIETTAASLSLDVNASTSEMTRLDVETNTYRALTILEQTPINAMTNDIVGTWNLSSYTSPTAMVIVQEGQFEDFANPDFQTKSGLLTFNPDGTLNELIEDDISLPVSGSYTILHNNVVITIGGAQHTLTLNSTKDTMVNVSTGISTAGDGYPIQTLTVILKPPQLP